MAIARLINPVSVESGTAYSVETWPYDDARFDSPEGRSWINFTIDSDGAEYEWRTPNDHIRGVANQLEAGAISVRAAARDAVVREWVDRRGDLFLDVYEDDIPKLRKASELVFTREMLLNVGVSLTDGDGAFAYYGEEDDSCARDAADALVLPPWAEVTTRDEGGPGSGYTATYIVLSQGKILDDLAEWLQSYRGAEA